MPFAGRGEPLIGPAEHGHLHVMSYNVRYAADDPDHLWEERRPVLAQLLDIERPCVIGTQEALFGQVADIALDLPSGYEWIGQGREGGSHGEYAAVFFDARGWERPQWFESNADLLQRYDGHRVHAAAAYNAGPSRVDRWRRDLDGLATDAWIEAIPFNETRNYVKNVLAFSYIYSQRLGEPIPFLDHD
jgi:hypothetical protein